MEAVGDVLIALSVLASFAGLWVRWSMYRSRKRLVTLLRANAHEREPGLTIDVLATSAGMASLEVRITNRAAAGNVVTGLFLVDGDAQFPSFSPGNPHLEAPFVIQANQSITGPIFFQTKEKTLAAPALVLIDLDARRVEKKIH